MFKATSYDAGVDEYRLLSPPGTYRRIVFSIRILSLHYLKDNIVPPEVGIRVKLSQREAKASCTTAQLPAFLPMEKCAS